MARKQLAAAAYASAQASSNPVAITFNYVQQVSLGTTAMPEEAVGLIDVDHQMLAAAALVSKALEDPQWDWRTIDGIHRSTGVGPEMIREILKKHQSELDIVESPQHRTLIRLKGKNTPRQRILKTLDTILDVLSLGKRTIVHF